MPARISGAEAKGELCAAPTIHHHATWPTRWGTRATSLAASPRCPGAHGRSLVPVLRGQQPRDWRTSVYYRYYHDPGHHNTRAHYGVRTATHKLIHYWKKDAWELFDLTRDPTEQRNIAGDPEQASKLADLKAEIARLQKISHRYLGYFFAIAKNPKLGLSAQHFFPAQQAGFPADAGYPEIGHDGLAEFFK